jgi:6-phosphogluconate dehydrogenase
MQLGMVGLGRMGSNMVRRLIKGGHECVVYDKDPKAAQQLESEGARPATTLAEFVKALSAPRAVWIMVPAGAPTEATITDLSMLLEEGDVILDGGNSYFKDDVARSERLCAKGIHYVDVGTSGGVWGLERGYCLMVGGETAVVQRLQPIFKTLSPGPGDLARTPGRDAKGGSAENGFIHCGPVGSGHFVKMIHNGIEYGIMQAYAEGFEILREANSSQLEPHHRYELNLSDISEVWRRGSVIGSWLLDLCAIALAEDENLTNYAGYVQDSGEGRWTIMAAIEEAVPAEVLSAALYTRFRSRQHQPFGEKLLSAMRNKFGGHMEQPPVL